MWHVKEVMNVTKLVNSTYWALRLSQWQVVMRGSDILRPKDQRTRKWDPVSDTHLGRVTWKEVNLEENHGCLVRMFWDLKQAKTDHAGDKGFQNIFCMTKNKECYPQQKPSATC